MSTRPDPQPDRTRIDQPSTEPPLMSRSETNRVLRNPTRTGPSSPLVSDLTQHRETLWHRFCIGYNFFTGFAILHTVVHSPVWSPSSTPLMSWTLPRRTISAHRMIKSSVLATHFLHAGFTTLFNKKIGSTFSIVLFVTHFLPDGI